MLRSQGKRGSRELKASTSPWFLGVLALAALWWTLDLAVLRAGVPHPADDHWEDDLIARQLVTGHGFRTPFIYPPLWSLRDPATLTVPVLVHGPLLPLVTAPALAALGPGAVSNVAPAAALVALLALWPIFRLGARWRDPKIGAAAAGLFTFSPLTLEAVHHSGSVVVGAALLAWTLDLLAREKPRAALGGAVAGLAYLVRPEMLLAFPFLALIAWRQAPRRWPGGKVRGPGPLARFVALFALVALPWWIHHAWIVGSPFFSLTGYTLIGFWGARPDVSVMQDFTLSPAAWPAVLSAELPHMAGKWLAFFPHAAKNALFTPSGGTGWLIPIGWLAGLLGTASPWAPSWSRRFVLFGFALAGIPVVTQTLTSHQRLYLVPFLPLYAIIAAAGAATVGRAMPPWARRPRAWIGLLVLLLLPSSLPAIKSAADESRPLARRLALERAALSDTAITSSARLLFSDTPDFVAWTTGRPTVWTTREQFQRLYAEARQGRPAPFGLPPRDQVAGWFHDDFRDPASVGAWSRP